MIDPGGDVPNILAAIEQAKVTVDQIWITHGHIDHVGGAAELRDTLKVPIEGPHIADKYLLDHVVESGANFGMAGVRNFAPDHWLDEGEQVKVGELAFDIYHCPGHSPGSVVFVNKGMRFAIVGDVLFNGSVGRTDLPRRRSCGADPLHQGQAAAARRRYRFHLRPRPRLELRPRTQNQPVSRRRDGLTTRRNRSALTGWITAATACINSCWRNGLPSFGNSASTPGGNSA